VSFGVNESILRGLTVFLNIIGIFGHCKRWLETPQSEMREEQYPNHFHLLESLGKPYYQEGIILESNGGIKSRTYPIKN
jgi:hypothetical protein